MHSRCLFTEPMLLSLTPSLPPPGPAVRPAGVSDGDQPQGSEGAQEGGIYYLEISGRASDERPRKALPLGLMWGSKEIVRARCGYGSWKASPPFPPTFAKTKTTARIWRTIHLTNISFVYFIINPLRVPYPGTPPSTPIRENRAQDAGL